MSATDRQLADVVRALSMDAVQRANSGHPGMPMGMADAATVLFRHFLKFSAAHPAWHDRDRFVLSAGHGSILLYSLLHLCGYEDFPLEELKRFRQLGARAAGHPEYGNGGGIETTTGPLGQGFANAVGMAAAERLLAAEFGDDLCSHRTWLVAGDGCLMEGISHEAASLAGHLGLAKLTVLFDDNNISIDGNTALAVSEDTMARFAAYGWETLSCDGHDAAAVAAALNAAVAATRPTIIAVKTTIGFGAPNKQGSAAAHGAPLGEDEIAAARATLGWEHPPFVVPDDLRQQWLAAGSRGDAAHAAWRKRLHAHPRAAEFESRLAGDLPSDWDSALNQWSDEMRQRGGEKMATRKAGGVALEKIAPHLPALLGGSADLTGSNNTYVGQTIIGGDGSGNLDGRYLHYGVREHAMAAMMNGFALHGGFIPYGGTFLVFSDYCRPAIRLAAMMNIRVVFVMTHDSIGLGEDGPTHQPIEHLAALRVIPNLHVWRPCDVAETAACWRQALLRKDGPSLLALSRQGLPYVGDGGRCARGGGALDMGGTARHDITLAASGSEVSLLLQSRELLAAKGINAAVISMPCMELFMQQDADWRREVLPPDVPLLAVEAAHPMPWQALATESGITRFDCLCLSDFGVSAPAEDAFQHFGLTAESCVNRALALLS